MAQVAEQAAQNTGDGHSVISSGGGIAVNLAGALARILNWGSPLVHVPTTLVAMADAAPSARHSLNTTDRKGALGLLNPPAAIVCDPCLLTTLSRSALRDGLIGEPGIRQCGWFS